MYQTYRVFIEILMSVVGEWTEKTTTGHVRRTAAPVRSEFRPSRGPGAINTATRACCSVASLGVYFRYFVIIFFFYSLLPPLKKIKNPKHRSTFYPPFLWFFLSFVLLSSQGKWKGCYGIIGRTKSWCGTSEPIIIRSSIRYKSDTMTKWASLPER